MTTPEVLITGAGPTGLMMACQLAMHHIPFRIIDKTEDHTTQSRALVIQARSMEMLDQMGIAKKAIQQGKITRATGAFFNGKKVLRITVNDMGKVSLNSHICSCSNNLILKRYWSNFWVNLGIRLKEKLH